LANASHASGYLVMQNNFEVKYKPTLSDIKNEEMNVVLDYKSALPVISRKIMLAENYKDNFITCISGENSINTGVQS
jgi:hypothetical protein